MIDEAKAILSGILRSAELMAVSAKTAPKPRGIDNIKTIILDCREELEKLASFMEKLAAEHGAFFKRDAESIRKSDMVVLIGCSMVDLNLKQPEEYGVDASTALSLISLGIAIGSAVKTADILNIDNRIMYSAGLAAQKMGLLNADYVLAVPLSVKSKNIFFDRMKIGGR